jgi:hypothetical protein
VGWGGVDMHGVLYRRYRHIMLFLRNCSHMLMYSLRRMRAADTTVYDLHSALYTVVPELRI